MVKGDIHHSIVKDDRLGLSPYCSNVGCLVKFKSLFMSSCDNIPELLLLWSEVFIFLIHCIAKHFDHARGGQEGQGLVAC